MALSILFLFAPWFTALAAPLAETASRAVRVGLFDNQPVVFADDQQYIQGIYVEILEEIARIEGWRIQYKLGTLEQNIRRLREGSIDVIGGFPPHHDYQVYLESSQYYLTLTWGRVYLASRDSAETLLDLQNMRVAVVKDNPHTWQFRQQCRAFALECHYVEVSDYGEVFDALVGGRAEAGVINQFQANRYAGEYAVYPSPILLPPIHLGLSALKGSHRQILETFDRHVNQWRKNPQSYMNQIIERWTRELPRRKGFLFIPANITWVHLRNGLLGLAGIVLFMLLASRVLRHQVNKRLADIQGELDNLRRGERQYRILVESLPYGLQEADTRGNIVFTNSAEHQIRRYSPGELIGLSMPDMAASDTEKERFQAYLRRLVKEQPEPEPYYHKVVRKDGRIAELRWEWNYKRDEQGRVIGFIALVTDVTEIEQTKRQIVNRHGNLKRLAEERAADLADAYRDLLVTATVFESTTEAILVTNLEGGIHTVNPAFCRITGYSQAEIQGTPLIQLSAQRHAEKFYARLWQVLKKQGQWQGEVSNRRKDGEIYPAWLSINAVRDSHDEINQYVALLSDITKRKQYEKQIWRQANYDALTGLPNRNLFHRRLEQAINQATAGKDQLAALMFIDLDRFKEVNDSLGHDAGDELLKAVTQRLRGCVRKSDTVARMGGDEFTVILPQLENREGAAKVAQAILEQLNQPFQILGHEVNISGSVGIVLCPRDGDNLITLLKNADIAMYRIKESGRNSYCFFSETR